LYTVGGSRTDYALERPVDARVQLRIDLRMDAAEGGTPRRDALTHGRTRLHQRARNVPLVNADEREDRLQHLGRAGTYVVVEEYEHLLAFEEAEPAREMLVIEGGSKQSFAVLFQRLFKSARVGRPVPLM